MKRLQFVHIPKTGGMSIEDTYRDQNWGRFGDQRVIPNKTSPYCTFWHNHENHVFLMEKTDTFCVIRDPIDRVLSSYRYGYPGLNGKDIQRDDAESLNTFIEKMVPNQNEYIFDNHFRPQSEFASKCTHVLLFDHIREDVQKLVKKYEIEPRELLHVNQTSARFKNITRDAISDANIKIIKEKYADDFELYETLRNHRSKFNQ